MQIAMQWSWLHSNKAGNNKEDARCVALAERKRMPSLHKAIQSCHPLPLSGCCTRLVAQASASSPHLIRERRGEESKSSLCRKAAFFFSFIFVANQVTNPSSSQNPPNHAGNKPQVRHPHWRRRIGTRTPRRSVREVSFLCRWFLSVLSLFGVCFLEVCCGECKLSLDLFSEISNCSKVLAFCSWLWFCQIHPGVSLFWWEEVVHSAWSSWAVSTVHEPRGRKKKQRNGIFPCSVLQTDGLIQLYSNCLIIIML